MNKSITLFCVFVFLYFVSHVHAQKILVYDPLDSTTVGQIIGAGSFRSLGGWRSGGGKIVFDAGHNVSRGYFEAKMRGWTAPAQNVAKTHPLSGWEFANQYARVTQQGSYWNWRIGEGYNPFKVLAKDQANGTRYEARVGRNDNVNDGESHTYRVEWSPNRVTFYFDGFELKSFSFPRYQLRYFTIGNDDNYGVSSPSPTITDVVIVDYNLMPTPELDVITDTLATGTYRQAYEDTLIVDGGDEPFHWSILEGELPDSLSFDESSGQIHGIPYRSGQFELTILVTDQSPMMKSDMAKVFLTVQNDPPVITSIDSVSVLLEQELIYQPTVVDPDDHPITLELGNRPSWLVWSDTVVTGIPTMGVQDTSFWIIASDGDMEDSLEVYITVTYPDLTMITSDLAPAVYMHPYTDSLVVQGGRLPYEWRVISGILPQEVDLDSSTGHLQGIPSLSGSFNFIVEVTDHYDPVKSISEQFTLTVQNDAPVFISPDTVGVWVDEPLMYLPQALDPNENAVDFSIIESPSWIGMLDSLIVGSPDIHDQDTLFILIASDGDKQDTLIVHVDVRGNNTSEAGYGPTIPAKFELFQNYPNPFNASTLISYSVPKISDVKLDIFDIRGVWVETLVYHKHKPGEYRAFWSSESVSSGMYIYRISNGSEIRMRKMVVVK